VGPRASAARGAVFAAAVARPEGTSVSSLHLWAPPDLRTAVGRKRAEGVLRTIFFPRAAEEYQAEFPLVLQ
jgi:hypothetical protein